MARLTFFILLLVNESLLEVQVLILISAYLFGLSYGILGESTNYSLYNDALNSLIR